MTPATDTDNAAPPVSLERLALGIALIAIGTLMVLHKLDVVHLPRLHGLWPLFPIALGLARLATPGRRHGGIVLLGVGLIFTAPMLGLASIRQLWPLFLVLGGVSMLTRTWSEDCAAPGTRRRAS
jgi:hypothetical protein